MFRIPLSYFEDICSSAKLYVCKQRRTDKLSFEKYSEYEPPIRLLSWTKCYPALDMLASDTV